MSLLSFCSPWCEGWLRGFASSVNFTAPACAPDWRWDAPRPAKRQDEPKSDSTSEAPQTIGVHFQRNDVVAALLESLHHVLVIPRARIICGLHANHKMHDACAQPPAPRQQHTARNNSTWTSCHALLPWMPEHEKSKDQFTTMPASGDSPSSRLVTFSPKANCGWCFFK